MHILDRMIQDRIDMEAAQALENAKLASAMNGIKGGDMLSDLSDDELSALADFCVFLLQDRNPLGDYDTEPF